MGEDLRIHERVQVVAGASVLGYSSGTKGRIVFGPAFAAGQRYYIVNMDNDRSGKGIIFLAEEIESEPVLFATAAQQPRTMPTPTGLNLRCTRREMTS